MKSDRNKRTNPADWRIATSWSLRDGHTPAAMKVAGLSSVELVLDYKNLEEIFSDGKRQLFEISVQQLHDAQMELWSVHLPFTRELDISVTDPVHRRAVIEAQAELLQMAASWNVQHAVIHPSYEPIEDDEREARIAACSESLRELSSLATSMGIRLAAECLPRTCLANTSEEMLRLIADAPECGVCCDVNHLYQESPASFIRTLEGRITTIHISDFDGIDEKHWMPGEGVIDWNDVLDALADIGYNGPFLFEVIKSEPEALVTCYKTLLERT
ncbi:TIM barrel protein [Paenibacillus sp. HJL G12]|uniref:TIM barrel protein n=1 Tax=Paenibacillus dendrobii TaxID=2691084 RepID=A0A7X3IP38_9BACL|nr:sugar phosphate isomerase/epimerase family protein [Paenibacillus dendrobii]MWV47170.1 TIM barrel protein [Paenibacillus dendrobii]